MRVLAGDLVDNALIVQSLEGLQAELVDLAARLDAAEGAASALPHREHYLRLVHRLGRELLRVHSDWADDVE